MKNGILVIGSTNIDMVASVSHLPVPGETIGDATFSVKYGGKGANQAIAAARAGGEVTFFSFLGDDSYGNALINHFRENQINSSYIVQEAGVPTGTAFIFVAENGENCIVVAPGANKEMSLERINDFMTSIRNYKAVILQLEIPGETVYAIIKEAYRNQVKVIFNPSPCHSSAIDILKYTDVLIVNEIEATELAELKNTKVPIHVIAKKLQEKNVGVVIVTLGENGCYVLSADVDQYFRGHRVNVVDTTGAGDTFCGSFTSKFMESNDLVKSVEYALASSAIAVTKLGAQTAIPVKEEVDSFLIKQSAYEI
ncbi:ribokinase [Pedobacter nyackensis]|uniref:Ribokinase n=1 Tax=Pedobacter nyackensis TaxID=475255 RepID=A0A1W2D168_9SPHI|nr:ribokinase [Pedobacter nyackensis]SMC91259.1 ribokinase [Pedobacter nyackensis]